MIQKIEVASIIPDARADVRAKKLRGMGFSVNNVDLVDVYNFDERFKTITDAVTVAKTLSNPVFQETKETITPSTKFNYAIEIGLQPGVTDNVGNTARETIEDTLGIKMEGQGVFTSKTMFVRGDISREDAEKIGDAFANPVIERIRIKSYDEFSADGGMGAFVPKVNLTEKPRADLVKILEMNDAELTVLGKQGILNEDGSSRGPLALGPTYMKAIQEKFQELGRNPTDIELEVLGQTWSEHCCHTIFGDQIDDNKEGLYRSKIKAATNLIRKLKGDKDFCVSVFKDNSGVVEFDENYNITDKVETHNSPSALDPFGGAITGIVGVNRDTIGCGLGAKPIINRYGFCFTTPGDDTILYKGPNKTQKMLSGQRIMDGVIDGVNVGGNCSGIPTPQGFVYFDKRYRGKPLVFVGTIGIMPKTSAGRPSHEKKARVGDYVVRAGGRVGKDGIHGATFSSEAMGAGSPMGAVQIGDPITQKKMSDAIVKEARDLGLYNDLTDNGAGGLSSSVGEMSLASGGVRVHLEKIPLKYSGLQLWESYISESQEAMTLAVSPDKWPEFSDLMKRRGVEATVIGEFTDSGNCVLDYKGKTVMDLDLEFLHNGRPARPMTTEKPVRNLKEPNISEPENLNKTLCDMLSRPNITSSEFISQQYDHEVQGGSVLKPLQGKGRVNADATITRPVLDSKKGVITSQGINPSYSDISTYDMAACAIDTAVRNAIAVGADLEKIALLDNFCWCSGDDEKRLSELVDATQACYDTAVAYQTPFISGKDSMHNDFKGFDKDGNEIKISVPPTLLVSSLAVMDDVTKAVSLDAKIAGDLVYVLGITKDELGGSEYLAMRGEQETGEAYVGKNVPKVDTKTNKELYSRLHNVIDKELVASAIGVGKGGLGVALAKIAIAGRLGMDIDLDYVSRIWDHSKPMSENWGSRSDSVLFSESQGRFVVTVAPENRQKFENYVLGGDHLCSEIGKIRADDKFIIGPPEISGNMKMQINTTVSQLASSYKSTFKDL